MFQIFFPQILRGCEMGKKITQLFPASRAGTTQAASLQQRGALDLPEKLPFQMTGVLQASL